MKDRKMYNVKVYNKTTNENIKNIKIEGHIIDKLIADEYLGNIITQDRKTYLDFVIRTQKANNQYYSINKTILGKK